MFAKISVEKPYTVAVGAILVIVLGVISFMNMTTDLLPNMNLPYIVVYTAYAGASPEAVETTVTKPLEAAVASVSDLANVTSTSKESVSMITLEFNDGASMDTAMLEINAKIDLVKPGWPDDVGTPTMIKINPDMLPVIVAAVDLSGKDIIELSDYVNDTLIGQLEGIDGVASVSASGLVEEEISVRIDQKLIDRVNSVILKEVDAELYKVERELLDGEDALNEAKQKLDKEGRKGLKQLDAALEQIRAARENMPATIASMEEKKAEAEKQLETLRAQQAQIEKALAQLEGAAMSDQLKAAYDQLVALIAEKRAAVAQKQARIAEINALLGLEGAGAQGQRSRLSDLPDDPIREADDGDGTQRSKIQSDHLTEADDSTPGKTPAPGGKARKSRLNGKTKGKPIREAKGLSFMRTAFAEQADPARESLLAEKMKLEADIALIEADIAQIEQSESYQNLKALADAVAQRETLKDQLAQVKAGAEQARAGIAQIADMIAKLNRGIIPGGMIEGIDEDTALDDAEAELIKTRKKAKAQLDKAARKIADGQKELGEARKEFEEKREDAFEDAKLDGVITVPLIGQIIAAQNFSMPAGYLKEDGQDYLVRVGDEFADIDELRDTLLFTMDLDSIKEVRLGDVAAVAFTNNADDVYAKVNRNDGVLLSFQKQSTYSTADVADRILAQFTLLQQKTPGLRLTPLLNQGIYIDMVVSSVIDNLLWGAALAVLVLLLFLGDFRPTLVVALSIPISVVAAFVAMYFTGITLNVMSLAGLALGVGMLVDNSIVVIENIYRLRGEGMPVLEACVKGAKSMSGAIFASTLTTICVFLPLVFVTGIAKQLFTDLGLTIAYALLASLLVALTVVPAMSSAILRRRQRARKHRAFTLIQRAYAGLLSFTLRFKLPVLLLAVALLVFSGAQALRMGTSFMPEVDSQQMTATLAVPPENTFEQTAALTGRVLDALLPIRGVDTVGVFSAGGAVLSAAGGGSDSAMTFYITLRADKGRKNTVIAEEMMRAVEPLGCDLSIRTSNMDVTMLYGSGISVDVKGPDIGALRRIASDVAEKMRAIEGVTDVSDGQEDSVPEITLTVDKQAAIENGLTVAQIYQFVYQLVSEGSKVATLTAGETAKEYAVMAVDGKNLGMTREDLADRTIEVKKANETIQVRLGDVCDIAQTQSLSAIRRDGQQHVLSAACDADAEHNIGLIGREVQAIVDGYSLPAGYTMRVSGESDTISSTIRDLISMIALGVVLIYLIMVAQFQSFLMPFIVLFTIPLAFTGGLLALIAFRMDVSMVSMLGMLILAGVIVNNGIVFVDSVNQMRLAGTDKREALIETGRLRLRPILMTALTTILGMSTMALGRGMGAEMLQAMAVVTIGGLTYGTLLTLFVVPALYDMMTGRQVKRRRVRNAAREIGGAQPPELETEDV